MNGRTWYDAFTSAIGATSTNMKILSGNLSLAGRPASTGNSGGKSQVATLNLRPGRYAFVCFLPDRDEPNKPHFKKGLLKEVTIPAS